MGRHRSRAGGRIAARCCERIQSDVPRGGLCSGGPCLDSPGEFCIFRKQLVNRSFDLIPNRPDGNTENPLAPAEDVDDLFFGVSGVDGLTVAQQSHVGQRLIGIELFPENQDGRPDLLETHSGVEKSLDHFELDHVGE